MSTVDNYFEQPASGTKDNVLHLGGTVVGADGSQAPTIARIGNAATGTEIATAVNALIDALRNVGVTPAPSD